MYLSWKTPLGRLRSYQRDLTRLYSDAVQHRQWDRARELWERRQRVRRAVLQVEEWQGELTPLQNSASAA